jgi:iron complex transport system ATP-binding protein
MTRLTLEQLTLRAGDRTLVESLDLSLSGGESWAVLGPNGSGKSTLVHTLAGLQAPAAGTVRLDRIPLSQVDARERARRMAVLFQSDDHSFPATVLEIALSGRYPYGTRSWLGRDDAQDLAIAHQALETVDLAGLDGRLVSSLSGGERRRLEIAAILAQDAEIRLLDEPTNHLDLRHQSAILELLISGRGKTALNLLVLHDPNLATRYCSHVLLLSGDGASIAGPVSEVLSSETLEQVFRCPITELRQGDHVFYVPG